MGKAPRDTQHMVGKLLQDGEGVRDAIHIAVLPVIAGEDWMQPGDALKFAYGSRSVVLKAKPEYGDPGVGVVDPFLDLSRPPYRVQKDQRFFMFLYPNTVQGMVHHWTHPVVDAVDAPANEHEQWLREFAQKWNFDYDEMIAAATAPPPEIGNEWDGNFVTARGRDLHSAGELGDDHTLFWIHLEGLTGKSYNQKHQESFGWSCTC